MSEDTNEEETVKVGARRPSVAKRDHDVARALQSEDKPLTQLSEELSLDGKAVYGSIWRLRKQELVVKVNVGSRTPNWHLTDEGQKFAASEAPEVPKRKAKEPKEEQTQEPAFDPRVQEAAAPEAAADTVPSF